MTFAGKVAVVTGVAGGMGRAIATALVGAGADVVGLDTAQSLPLDGLDARQSCGELTAHQGSVDDWEFVSNAVAETKARFGRIDYLVNAAGVLWFDRDVSAIDMDLDVWDQVMSINLKGCVHTIKAVVPLMKDEGGAMVHFSTIQCLRGDRLPQDAYQASKAGLIALSKSIAVQYATAGIRSNCILPGPTMSPMQSRWTEDPAQAAAVAEAVPLGRIGTVDDMADACLFLLSDRAGFITGTELIVDGGLTALP